MPRRISAFDGVLRGFWLKGFSTSGLRGDYVKDLGLKGFKISGLNEIKGFGPDRLLT